MKYVFLVPDGAADYPLDDLKGKTPLEVANTPNLDYLAKNGIVGMVETIPQDMSPGSDVASLSLLGYDPAKYYTGRGPLEAASCGIELEPSETAFRCNLITVSDDTLKDYSAGHITSGEAGKLIRFVDEKLGSEVRRFYSGVSYRHLFITGGDFSNLSCTPPHNVVGEPIKKNLPEGQGQDSLRKLILASREILEGHEVNQRRRAEGKNPANMIWLWGQGKAPSMPPFHRRFGLSGTIISAVDLIKGIADCLGLDHPDVPGATGYYDTNYQGKVEYALKALETQDFVFVHVEATDEAGHSGDVNKKVEMIEEFDVKVVRGILTSLKNYSHYRVLVAPDHATPISCRTHTSDAVPFAIYTQPEKARSGRNFNEREIKECSSCIEENSLYLKEGHRLMSLFVGRDRRQSRNSKRKRQNNNLKLKTNDGE